MSLGKRFTKEMAINAKEGKSKITPTKTLTTKPRMLKNFVGAIFSLIAVLSELSLLRISNTNATIAGINKIVEITPKEFEILTYLIHNKNIAISREQLLSNVWGYDYFGDDRTIDTHIKMLRNNLDKYRNHIITIRGIGYKYVENEE